MFDVVCTVHHPTIRTEWAKGRYTVLITIIIYCILYTCFWPTLYMNQQDAQNSLIRLHFLLDALRVSDYISPTSGATL